MSSNASDDDSFIGYDMSGRAYVARTLLGGFVEMYGVGRVSVEPGIYIAAPAYQDGFLVGAVIAKVSIDRLRHWVSRPGTFVTDKNSVIVMAHDGRLEYEAMPNAPVARMTERERVEHYRASRFRNCASLTSASRCAPRNTGSRKPFYAANGSNVPSLYDERTGLNSGLSAHIVHPLTSWPEISRNHNRDRFLVFLTMLGIVTLAMVIATSYSRERRLHRATRDLAAQLQSANTLLSAEARHDALTGALSRRYFLDTLRHEVELARSVGTPLSVAIADLDHFKQINDRFGHASGDRVLEHFVEVCRAQLRPSDAIGRLGGEEFGILLPQTSLADAQAVLERLRKRFHHKHCAHLPDDAALSVSIGITELALDDALEWILSRADLALYEAKSRGRDRSEVRPADPAPPRDIRKIRSPANKTAGFIYPSSPCHVTARSCACRDARIRQVSSIFDIECRWPQSEDYMKGNLVIVCRDQDAETFDQLLAEYGSFQTRLSSTTWFLKIDLAPEVIQEEILSRLGKYTTHYIFEASTVTYNTVDSEAASALETLFD